MNRKEEYRALLSELEQLPPELEQTVERAVRRKRKLRNGAFGEFRSEASPLVF